MPNRRNAFYVLLIFSLLLDCQRANVFFQPRLCAGRMLIGSFLWSWTSVNWLNISRYTPARRAQVGRSLNESF